MDAPLAIPLPISKHCPLYPYTGQVIDNSGPSMGLDEKWKIIIRDPRSKSSISGTGASVSAAIDTVISETATAKFDANAVAKMVESAPVLLQPFLDRFGQPFAIGPAILVAQLSNYAWDDAVPSPKAQFGRTTGEGNAGRRTEKLYQFDGRYFLMRRLTLPRALFIDRPTGLFNTSSLFALSPFDLFPWFVDRFQELLPTEGGSAVRAAS